MLKYQASFLMGLERSLEYRFEFFINIISTFFPIIIQVFLWFAIYSGTGQGQMYGYSLPQMLAYVAIAGAVGKFVVTGIEYMVNEDIHSGGLAVFLVKPVKYVRFRIFQVMGEKFTSSITMLIFTAAVIAVLRISVGFEINFWNILSFIIALLLAAFLNFYIFFLVSISAFWLTEVGRFFHALQVIIMVISGGVFPISVFGEGYVAVSRYFPFQYTTYFPIGVLTGAVNTTEIYTGIFLQIVWIIILWLVSNVLWRVGLKRYVAVGG